MFEVQAVFDVRAKGGTFGPFDKRHEAEDCVLVVAARPDVVSAKIVDDKKEKRHGNV